MMTETETRSNGTEARPEDRPRGGEEAADMHVRIGEILNRRPAVGLALGVVRNGQLEFFEGHGLADIVTGMPITEGTVFRVGSITKLFTAIAVMQLVEQGLVDLNAPVNDFLRAYSLIPDEDGWRPATLRHLLTHTAGIPDVRHTTDLLHASLTASGGRPPHLSVEFGTRLPSLAEYYRGGLRVVVEPGSAFAYSNHGYATLGQIVEDVTAITLDRYFRERIFDPLGMADSDLVRSDRIASRLATGYAFGSHGAKAVADRDWIGAGAGGVYSTTGDMARFVAALLGGGATNTGTCSNPRRSRRCSSRTTSRTRGCRGWVSGSSAATPRATASSFTTGSCQASTRSFCVAPDDGIGVIALTNGSSGAFAWLSIELGRLLGEMLGVPEDAVRSDIPHHPEMWAELCGRYLFPARIADLRQRLMLGGGAEVFVRGGRLMVRLLTPVPMLYRGLPLDPDDPTDPYVFRLDLSPFGMPPVRAAFGRAVDGRATEIHTDLGGQPWSLIRARDAGTTRRAWLRPAAGALAVAGVVKAVRRHQRRAST